VESKLRAQGASMQGGTRDVAKPYQRCLRSQWCGQLTASAYFVQIDNTALNVVRSAGLVDLILGRRCVVVVADGDPEVTLSATGVQVLRHTKGWLVAHCGAVLWSRICCMKVKLALFPWCFTEEASVQRSPDFLDCHAAQGLSTSTRTVVIHLFVRHVQA